MNVEAVEGSSREPMRPSSIPASMSRRTTASPPGCDESPIRRPEVLGGEPVFAGTRVSVRHVGELAKRGASPATLHEDFPSLSKSDIEFARIFVELGRPPGRPRKLRFVRS
jgi:uncharacterized protein (DUF433 family)